jgi:hypothetical protein
MGRRSSRLEESSKRNEPIKKSKPRAAILKQPITTRRSTRHSKTNANSSTSNAASIEKITSEEVENVEKSIVKQVGRVRIKKKPTLLSKNKKLPRRSKRQTNTTQQSDSTTTIITIKIPLISKQSKSKRRRGFHFFFV